MKHNSEKTGKKHIIVRIVSLLAVICVVGYLSYGVSTGEIQSMRDLVQKLSNLDPNHTGVSAELRRTLDQYESFTEEYVQFMEEYNEAKDKASLEKSYTEYADRYSKIMKEVGSINVNKLNAEDMKYFEEVTERTQSRMKDIKMQQP